jgi:hypothetical protein
MAEMTQIGEVGDHIENTIIIVTMTIITIKLISIEEIVSRRCVIYFKFYYRFMLKIISQIFVEKFFL